VSGAADEQAIANPDAAMSAAMTRFTTATSEDW
jgi:hypothetical protein